MLNILIGGNRNSVPVIDNDALYRLNYVDVATDVAQGDRTNPDTPKGVLGGSVACLKADNTVGAPDADQAAPLPMGLFLTDAAGSPWENTAAVASGKVTVITGYGALVAVDVYETKSAAGVDLDEYAFGDPLYCSQHGFLTKEAPTVGNGFHARQLATVMMAPGDDQMIVIQLEV